MVDKISGDYVNGKPRRFSVEICQPIITTILKDPMPFHHAARTPGGCSSFHSIPIKKQGENIKQTLKVQNCCPVQVVSTLILAH